MTQTPKQIAINAAKSASGQSYARLAGMKLRTRFDPPAPAVGKFPYPARTCAEWEELPGGKICEREMTDVERRRDARLGSRRLREAILMAAA